MADDMISELTALTTPADADVMIINDDDETPPNLTKKVTWANIKATLKAYLDTLYSPIHGGYTLNLGAPVTGVNCADSTPYYWGARPGAAMSTSADALRVYIPRAGTITQVSGWFTYTNGSAETSTLSIRLNNTTDTTVSAAIALNSTPSVYTVTGLSIAVVAGDYIEMKWVTPAWATNPTGVKVDFWVFVQTT